MAIEGMTTGFNRPAECIRCKAVLPGALMLQPAGLAWVSSQSDRAHMDHDSCGLCPKCGPEFMLMFEHWLEGKVAKPEPETKCRRGHNQRGSFCYTCYTG